MLNLTTLLHMPLTPEGLQQGARQLASLADACREDPDLRSNLDSDPAATLAENGVGLRPDSEVRVVEDSDEVFHFILPPDNFNADVRDEVLDTVAGGGKCTPANNGCAGYGGCARGPSCGCGAGGCIDSWTFGRD